MEEKWAKGANGTKKGIVQMYTASVQQTGRTLKDKGEKEWKEVGARANNNTYLKQVHKTKQYNNKYTKQARRKHTSTNSILLDLNFHL